MKRYEHRAISVATYIVVVLTLGFTTFSYVSDVSAMGNQRKVIGEILSTDGDHTTNEDCTSSGVSGLQAA